MPVSTNNEALMRAFMDVYGLRMMEEQLRTLQRMEAAAARIPPLPWRARLARRIRNRWYSARVWVAEKILRLPQGRE